jgi:hypothetical protein
VALVQIRESASDATPAVTAAAAPASGTTPRWQVVAASFAAIVITWGLSIVINASFQPRALVIPAGISLFAMLYAVTQGLERLLEPVSAFFFTTKTHVQNRNSTLATAVNLQTATDAELPAKLAEQARAEKVARGLGADDPPPQAPPGGRWRRSPTTERVTAARVRLREIVTSALAGDESDPGRMMSKIAGDLDIPESDAPAVAKKAAVELAAAAQADLDQRRVDKAVAYWALATVLGLLLSATLGMYLLHIVGLRGDGLGPSGSWAGGLFTAPGFRHMLDLLVTGLAIGGGTKPLHDLISNLQAAKVSKKDPSQTR